MREQVAPTEIYVKNRQKTYLKWTNNHMCTCVCIHLIAGIMQQKQTGKNLLEMDKQPHIHVCIHLITGVTLQNVLF